jgi:hypothetical protein
MLASGQAIRLSKAIKMNREEIRLDSDPGVGYRDVDAAINRRYGPLLIRP